MLLLFLLLVTVLNCLSALLDVTEAHHQLKTHKKPVLGIPSVYDRGIVSRAVLSVDSWFSPPPGVVDAPSLWTFMSRLDSAWRDEKFLHLVLTTHAADLDVESLAGTA